MTSKTDTQAISTTANAAKLSTAAGANVENLRQLLLAHLTGAAILVKQIIALTPSGDANLSALNAILTGLL
jgi:hypothetical protein